MSLRLHIHDTARPFLDRAQPWLLRNEAEHSLVLGIAGRLAASASRPATSASGAFFATVERDGEVVGVAVRTPPHKLLLSQMPLDAVPLVADAAERFESIPAVLGPQDVAQAFGREWARRREVVPRLGMRERIFELTDLIPPARRAGGQARVAGAADMEQAITWVDAFHRDVGIAEKNPREWAEHHVPRGHVLLWEDEETVAMAAEVARSPSGARVGAAYTPPALRGRGYATAVVADLTRRLLADGLRFCSLYTDLANPISNAIYQRLGYRPIADVVDVEFA